MESGEVGSVFVRIRPHLAERDARALDALDRLVHELADAFDRFREATDPQAQALPELRPAEEEAA